MSVRARAALLGLSLGVSVATAGAEGAPPGPPPAPAPQPGPYAPAPSYYPPPPPPLPPPDLQKRGVRQHDGFFLRMGLGFAGMLTKTEGTLGQAEPGGDLRGGGGTLELLLGGTPARGFVLGGGLVTHTFVRPTYQSGGASTRLDDTELGLTFVALFGQLYFDETGGAYLQALVAAAEEAYRYQAAGDQRETELGGVGLGVGGGWDFWVGDQWSLGPELRLCWAGVKHEDAGVVTRHDTTVLTLSFTATLH